MCTSGATHAARRVALYVDPEQRAYRDKDAELGYQIEQTNAATAGFILARRQAAMSAKPLLRRGARQNDIFR